METHDWLCGCGHWNGPNLANCGGCTRPAQESEVHPKSDPDEPVDSDEVIPGSLDWWDRVHHPAPCNCEALKAALRWALLDAKSYREEADLHVAQQDREKHAECCSLAGLDPETLEAVDEEREE